MKFFITGGTGSIGEQLIKDLLEKYPDSEVISFSNNEEKVFDAKEHVDSSKVSYIVGDVSDFSSVLAASQGVDAIIHLAAIKHIDIAEENPLETTRVNILGTSNVIQATKINNVSRLIYISTDKAATSSSIYGLSKLISEKMVINSSTEKNKMSVVRFGNIINSSGSVFPKWKAQVSSGRKITVTDPESTRFFMPVFRATGLILKVLENFRGKEIFVPKMKSFKMYDIALFFAKEDTGIEIIGLRAGEKKHESAMSSRELGHLVEKDDYFIIEKSNKPLPEMSSDDPEFLSNIEQIEIYLKK